MTHLNVGGAARVSGTNPNLVQARLIRLKDNQRLRGKGAEVWSDDEPEVVQELLNRGYVITHYTHCPSLTRMYLLVYGG